MYLMIDGKGGGSRVKKVKGLRSTNGSPPNSHADIT